MRKPEPLGTEFKCAVDGLTGTLLWLEIQEGKARMANKEHQKTLGATAACVLRGLQFLQEMTTIPPLPPASPSEENDDDVPEVTPKLHLADSWFGSVTAAENVAKAGHHAIFIIKTGSSRVPKKFLEDKMKDYPGGTWITLEGQTENGVDLICIGYKYNKKKVLVFLTTRGAGATLDGDPYEARFPDRYGNVCTRDIARPEVISTYFKYCNVVDLHNQARQCDLALEKKWVTQDGYFRLYTTMIGMNVVDCWKQRKFVKHKEDSVCQFADLLAADMIELTCTKEVEKEGEFSEDTPEVRSPAAVVSISKQEDVSGISSVNGVQQTHTKEIIKGQLRCVWCSRVNLMQSKTQMRCKECGKGFCRDNTGRGCWSHHVALGGCPQAPPKGTKRKLKREIENEEKG